MRLYLLALLALIATTTTCNAGDSSNGALPNAAAKAVPLAEALKADLGRDKDDHYETCADRKTPPVRIGLIILASEKSLAAAVKKARVISAKSGVAFSDEGFSIDPETKEERFRRPVYEKLRYDGDYTPRIGDSCKDDMGKQIDECITVESSSSYANLAPNLYIVVGGVIDPIYYGDGPKSEEIDVVRSKVARYRKSVPDVYVKYTALEGDPGGYGVTSSCADLSVIVLARTRSLDEADAIARAVSSAMAIPYTEAPPRSDLFFTESTGITVEYDSQYGEIPDPPYFLVAGGINLVSLVSSELLDRYKKHVPNAFLMKRALPVCGQ